MIALKGNITTEKCKKDIHNIISEWLNSLEDWEGTRDVIYFHYSDRTYELKVYCMSLDDVVAEYFYKGLVIIDCFSDLNNIDYLLNMIDTNI